MSDDSITEGFREKDTGFSADLSGSTVGDYRILRRLGQGGMGQVYLAEQISLRRKVALKFLRSDLANNKDSLKRFQNEAETVAQATHPSIVQVYAIGESDGRHFMALEYVEGRNLREYLSFKGTLDLAAALSVLRQVVSALVRASELGIVHRDIKPENILLTRKGEAKIADFGLARANAEQQSLHLTQTGMTLGTPLYMAPEQVEGKTIDFRTDMYSLGVTAYHMLAGKPPYKGENAFEVALKHLKGEVEPLEKIRTDIPVELCQLIRQMMMVEPDKRPPSFHQVNEKLSQICAMSGISKEVMAALPGITSILPSVDQSLPTTAFITKNAQPIFVLPWKKIIGLALLPCALGAGIWASWILQTKTDDSYVALPGELEDESIDLVAREKNLKMATEQFLNPKNKSPGNGTGACMDLGLLYLSKHQLDDAEKLFQSCCNLEKARDLGNLGMGIVYALKDNPKESLIYFKKPQATYIANTVNFNKDFAYWVKEAIFFNFKNGAPKTDLVFLEKIVDTPGPKLKK